MFSIISNVLNMLFVYIFPWLLCLHFHHTHIKREFYSAKPHTRTARAYRAAETLKSMESNAL